MKRTLTLRRESLNLLTTDELNDVVGGDAAESHIPTCPVNRCVNDLTWRLSCYCTLAC